MLYEVITHAADDEPPHDLRAYAGELERARRLTPAARTAIARRAAIRRWTRARFGSARYEDLRNNFV